MNKIALSFDVEDWYHSAPVSGASISKYGSLNEFMQHCEHEVIDCITEETKYILEILDKQQIKATFFVVADVAERYRELAISLKHSPHEIASHSLTHHSAIDSRDQTPLKPVGDWIDEQRRAKKTLEAIFEREIIGFRAPNAYFANWMVQPLYDMGFKYDSSIAYNSFYNKTNVKLGEIPTYPYYLDPGNLRPGRESRGLVELPWSYFKLGRIMRIPAGGAFFFRSLGFNYFRIVLNQALKNGDTMFYLHPLDLTTKKIPERNLLKRPAFWLNKGKRAERRFTKLLQEFKGRLTACENVYRRFLSCG
jgi:peptidoglycan-N-acetylglucosamine deacetylase